MKRKHFMVLLLTLGLLISCVSCGTATDRAAALQQAVLPSGVADETAPPQGPTTAPSQEPSPSSQKATAKPGGTTAAPQQNGGGQNAQAPQTQPPAATQKPAEAKIKIKVTVDCKTAVAQDEALRKQFGSGSMVSKTVELEQGATVYDALKKAAGNIGVSGGYVYKIGGLSEGDCGAGSGWMYSVNGVYVQKSCKQQKLADGDVVKWRYTCNNGKDLGASV